MIERFNAKPTTEKPKEFNNENKLKKDSNIIDDMVVTNVQLKLEGVAEPLIRNFINKLNQFYQPNYYPPTYVIRPKTSKLIQHAK